MTCSATTALGQETRQPPGNARLVDHRGRSVRAVDEDALRRGPLPRALFGVIRSPPRWGCMPAATRCGSARSMPRRAESGTGCVRSPSRARRVRRNWPARRRQRADVGRGRYRLRRHPMRVDSRGDSPVERVIGATVAPTCLCGQPTAWTHGSVRTAHGQHARADCPRKRRWVPPLGRDIGRPAIPPPTPPPQRLPLAQAAAPRLGPLTVGDLRVRPVPWSSNRRLRRWRRRAHRQDLQHRRAKWRGQPEPRPRAQPDALLLAIQHGDLRVQAQVSD